MKGSSDPRSRCGKSEQYVHGESRSNVGKKGAIQLPSTSKIPPCLYVTGCRREKQWHTKPPRHSTRSVPACPSRVRSPQSTKERVCPDPRGIQHQHTPSTTLRASNDNASKQAGKQRQSEQANPHATTERKGAHLTFAVASSITSTDDFRSKARAMHSSCRSPTLKFPPPSSTGESSPPALRIELSMRAWRSASHCTCVRGCVRPGGREPSS